MDYVTVSDLKHSRELWKKLSKEKELVLTRDGKPSALLLKIDSQNLEETIASVRRSLFSDAVTAIRRRAIDHVPSHRQIEKEIQDARKNQK